MDKAKQYSNKKHALIALNTFLMPVFIFFILRFGISGYIKDILSSMKLNNYISLIIFTISINTILYMIFLPIDFYSSFIVERRFSLSNQSLAAWIKKESKKNILSFVISLPFVLSLYIFLKLFPLYWWVYVSLLWFTVSILISKFASIIILPVFYKYSPIRNQRLKSIITDLAKKIGFKVDNIYEIDFSKDTKKANAAVIGLGKQKRIVLCDTLIENFSEDEIVSVMSHELGHHKMLHGVKLIISSGFSIFLTFFIINSLFLKNYVSLSGNKLYDFESLMVIYAAYSLMGIFMLPLQNALSRKLEKEADVFALQTTNKKEPFISMMKKLAQFNLADPDPNLFYRVMFYSHPPIKRRIELGESYKEK
ncbi:MAG: M48 family metallopeptidase [Candidatus Omnitrophota bacterium]